MVLNEVELEDAKDLKEKLPGIREDVKSKLARKGKNSKSGLKFVVNGRHGPIKVDVLPTFKFRGIKWNNLVIFNSTQSSFLSYIDDYNI